ncbi:MAG: hypothetical protein JXP34_27080 [Planctomycetes bacterium]|nr:hypothetical protein [Planctomycetota bacterium]
MRRKTNRKLFLWGAAALVASGAVLAGPLDVRAVGGTVTEGDPVTVTVYLDVNTAGIQAWQYGLCHDAGRLTYMSNAMGAGTAASQGGAAPDYADLDLYPGGLTWVVLIDYNLVHALPVGPNFEDLKVTYTAGMLAPADPDPTATQVSPCDKAFGTPPVAATYSIGGTSFPSTLLAGTVTIEKTPVSFFDVRVEDETVDEGDDVGVSIFIDTDATGVQGWQYGICHNAYLTAIGHALGASTQAFNGGAGPDFVDFDIHAGGETWVVLIDANNAGDSILAPGIGLEDVVVTYKAATLGSGDPDPTVVQVAPCDKVLGTPPVAAAYTIGGTSYPAGLIPGTVSIAKKPLPPPYFDVRAEDDTVEEGAQVALSFDIDTNVTGVNGWQYGICHNAYLTAVGRALGASTLAFNGGAGPDYSSFKVHAGGETWAVLIDADNAGDSVLPPGDGLEDVVVFYRAAALDPCGPDSVVVDVDPCDMALGSPPVAAAYTIGGTSYPVGLIQGHVTITKTPLVAQFDVEAEDETVGEGGTVDVSFSIDTNIPNVEAWQYGICHTADLSYVASAIGASTLALNGGAGPDYVDLSVYAGGETWAVLIDTDSAGDKTLPPGTDLEDLVVTYDARLLDPADPDPVTVAVAPCDMALGSPPVAAVYSTCGASHPAGLIPGSVEIAKIAVPFIRGDGNTDKVVDLADPVWILNYLFRSGPSGTCMLALDANGVAPVDLGDPIYLLNYLFSDGPEPPAPFPGCGTIPGQVLSQCTAYTCP